jgi:D-alanyl-lipoteichoic acid acyltransferase DltB (MBOAT superfamily)
VVFVIASAVVDFVLSNAIFRQNNAAKKKALLVCSIVFNLGMLFYFKYTSFFVAISNNLFNTGFSPLNILLPIGISFYTFENISYTIDVYRGEFKPVRRFSEYLLFLSFFPKLVMGPIVRAHDFVPQINNPYHISDKDFTKGFYLIISGLFKKLIISDYLTLNFVNYIFDDPVRYSGLENLFAVYGYAMVIYCDFSGYSDIALGIARWLGFTIPPNFLSPYQSKNITEFWRRWHISLSLWLKDYLYIPLGGNRKASFASYFFTVLFFAGFIQGSVSLLGLSYLIAFLLALGVLLLFVLPSIIQKSKSGVATNLNLLTTMLLGGLWHGANWNFIVWGAFHGISLAIHKIWVLLTGKRLASVNNSRWYNFISVVITFHFVCFCWIFFKAADFSTATNMLHQIVFNFNVGIFWSFFNGYKEVLGMMFLAILMHALPDSFADKLLEKCASWPLLAYIAIFFVFLFIYGVFKSSEQVMPIYLQF